MTPTTYLDRSSRLAARSVWWSWEEITRGIFILSFSITFEYLIIDKLRSASY